MLMFLSRSDFMHRIVGLGTQKLVVQVFEEEIQDYLRELEPELYNEFFVGNYRDGVYWPQQSLGLKQPNFKSKKTFLDEEALINWQYPPGDRITPEYLGIDVPEFTKGILFDIDHETKPWSVDPKEKIISQGWGTKMNFK